MGHQQLKGLAARQVVEGEPIPVAAAEHQPLFVNDYLAAAVPACCSMEVAPATISSVQQWIVEARLGDGKELRCGMRAWLMRAA